MIGNLIPEIILAIFSAGIGTAIKTGAQALAKAAKFIFQLLGKAVRITIEAIKTAITSINSVIKSIKTMAALFAKKGNKQLSKFFEKLEELFKRFKEFLKKKQKSQETPSSKKPDAGKKTPQKGKLNGTLDGLTPDEKRVVQDLLDSGKNVEIIPRSDKKTADFLIDGVKTELKTLQNSNANTAITRIQDAFKQGDAVILDARKTTFTNNEIDVIINRTIGTYSDKKLPGKVEVWIKNEIFTY